MELVLNNISKSYGAKKVLDNIGLKLTPGIYGFLGANGVGKTTLFSIISGYISNYSGKIYYPTSLDGDRTVMGILPQHFEGYPNMTVQEFMAYLGNLKSPNISKKKLAYDIDEKLSMFGLSELRKRKLGSLSGGQLRRCGIAQAFQLNPMVVLLDEPTTGLDPAERINFKNYISEISQDTIILLSTHIVSDLEYITKKIYILKNGRIIAEGTESQLLEQCHGKVKEMKFSNEHEARVLIDNAKVSMIYEHEKSCIVRFMDKRNKYANADVVSPNLNDVYLNYFEKERC